MFSTWFSKQDKPSKPQSQPIYTPITKHYVFNETGNIMLCATADSIQNFDTDLKSAFVDISVFFAAMTKAVTSTTNPVTGKPFSIFNYQAVKNILVESGLFIETNVEEGTFSHDGVGNALGKALFQHVLNREFSEKQLPFAKSMFNGMQYQRAKMAEQSEMTEAQQQLCRSGSIFFIGEHMVSMVKSDKAFGMLCGLINLSCIFNSDDFINRTVKNEKCFFELSNFLFLSLPLKIFQKRFFNFKDTSANSDFRLTLFFNFFFCISKKMSHVFGICRRANGTYSLDFGNLTGSRKHSGSAEAMSYKHSRRPFSFP